MGSGCSTQHQHTAAPREAHGSSTSNDGRHAEGQITSTKAPAAGEARSAGNTVSPPNEGEQEGSTRRQHPTSTKLVNSNKTFHSVLSRDTAAVPEPTATLSSSQLEVIDVPSATTATSTGDFEHEKQKLVHGPGFSPPVAQHSTTAWGTAQQVPSPPPRPTTSSNDNNMNLPPALVLHSSPTKAPLLPEPHTTGSFNNSRRQSNAVLSVQQAEFRARSFSGQSALVPVLPTYPTSEFGERDLSVGESQSIIMSGGAAGAGGLESANTQQRLLASGQLSPSQQLGESGALPFALSGQFGDSLGARAAESDSSSTATGGGTASPIVKASVLTCNSSPTTRSSGSPTSCDELPVKNDPLHPQSSNGDFGVLRNTNATGRATTCNGRSGGNSGTEEVDYNWLDLKQIADQESGLVGGGAGSVRRNSAGVGLGGGSGVFTQQSASMESNGSSMFANNNSHGSPMLHLIGTGNGSANHYHQQKRGSATSGSLSQVFTPPASIAGGSSMGGSPNHHGPLQFGNQTGGDGGGNSMSGSVRLQPPRQNGMSLSSSQYGGASPPTQQQQGLPRQLSGQYQQQSNAPWNYSISTDLQPSTGQPDNPSSSVPGLPLIVPVGTSPTSSTIGASFTNHTQQPYFDNSGTIPPRQKVQQLADISMLPPHSSDTTSSGTKSSSGGSGSGGKPSRQQRVVTRCPPLVVPDKSLPIYLSEPGSGSSSFQFNPNNNISTTVPLEDSLQSM